MTNLTKNKKMSGSAKDKAMEWIRCKNNPFYFIYNYVYILEDATGKGIKLSNTNLHFKLQRVIKSLYRFQKVVLMASRQLGKSTIAACIIAWATVFYPNIQIIILNIKKDAGLKNLERIKFIISHLPAWMVTNKPFKSKSDIVTYATLYNNAHIKVYFPSTIHPPTTVARSLTSPILYIDESGFIRDMVSIFGSAQQTLSKAREQAMKSGYPTFTLVTSTPNGTSGMGEWFYNRWTKSVDSDLLFDKSDWKKDIDIPKIVNDPSKNLFVGIKYHWSEDISKNQRWYDRQCQEISDQRIINQELDLLFVGTSNCIFSDQMLSSFTTIKPIDNITTLNGATLDIYQNEFDYNDYYLVGVDTAESLDGAFCTIEIFSFKHFNQIAELEFKYGSYTKFGEDIHFVVKWLIEIIGHDNIIMCNENNTIGKAPIEYLLYQVHDINYENYMFKEDPLNNKHDKYGVSTTGLTKPLMVGCLTQFVNENNKCIKSQKLVDQFSNIEKTGTGNIKSIGYSDLFMAVCFTAYVRKKRAMDILPIISVGSPDEYAEKQFNTFANIIKLSDMKTPLVNTYSSQEFVDKDDSYDSEDIMDIFGNQSNDFSSDFLPFFKV